MSEYTREEILKMIEEVEGPQNLDLSGKDLSGIDLSEEAIARQLEKVKALDPSRVPPWFSEETHGINLQKAILSGANFQKARLDVANLQEASLVRANLREARLDVANLQKAFLLLVNLQEANLSSANLQEASLVGAHLEKVDLSAATSLAGAHFHRAWLDQTRMTKEQLGGRIGEEIDNEYYEAREAYLLLKNNFNQIGRYDDASWAYRKERRMERMTHRPDLAPKYYDYPKLPEPLPTGAKGILHRVWLPLRKVGFRLRHLIHYVFDTAQLALCDFGENPWWVLIWAAVALLLFGLAYTGIGEIEPAPGVSFPISFGDHFVYSLFAFATMDHPRIVAATGLAEFLTAFEALVGIFLAATFVFTLGNRISRS